LLDTGDWLVFTLRAWRVLHAVLWVCIVDVGVKAKLRSGDRRRDVVKEVAVQQVPRFLYILPSLVGKTSTGVTVFWSAISLDTVWCTLGAALGSSGRRKNS